MKLTLFCATGEIGDIGERGNVGERGDVMAMMLVIFALLISSMNDT